MNKLSLQVKISLAFLSVAFLMLIASYIAFSTEDKFLSIVVATVASCIILVIWYFMLRTIILPVQRLREATARLAEGNFTKKLSVTTGDELGELTKGFNYMIDQLKQSYEILEQKKARDEVILESIGDGMLVVDNEQRILMMNKQGRSMLGWDISVIGKKFAESIPIMTQDGSPLPSEQSPVYRAVALGQKSVTSVASLGSLFFGKKDGGQMQVAITCAPIMVDKSIQGAIGIFRDITKEKEIDRMKTEFISLASHQLRTPLSAIKWFTEMLLAGDAGKLNTEQEEFAHNISESTQRMIELVNGLLNISRIESGRIVIDPSPTDLTEMVQSLVTELQVKLKEKKHRLIVSAHENLPKISIDPKLIRQVYLNLLTNAIKYTPEGGEITVFISRKGEEIISQVTDTGYGIPKNQQGKVFSRFFRAENILKVETDGTGLGLYLAKAIVESSLGKIWFQSEDGKGTTFWFSLPVQGTPAKKGEVSID